MKTTGTDCCRTAAPRRSRARIHAPRAGGIRSFLATLAWTTLALAAGCQRDGASSAVLSTPVPVEQARMSALHEETARRVNAAPPGVMQGTGLAGAMGGARLKLLRDGDHGVLIPSVQLADTQIPLAYTIVTAPANALVECALRTRGNRNTVVEILLRGRQDDEIEINWTALVLMVPNASGPAADPFEPFLQATACVQSEAKEITRLAQNLSSASGSIDGLATEIQRYIRSMQQKRQPRSMDALGILASGGNWICTANANLAAAFLRARNIPARTLAVIPVTSQRLEMHRTVEFFDQNQWLHFDPSSLQSQIPLKPWQNIIMAWTTIADENMAMIPRMGVSLGCPFGHELELLSRGVRLWGRDFFWTVAKPLVEFHVGDDAVKLAAEEWSKFLVTGKLSQAQIEAAAVTDGDALLQALRRSPHESTGAPNSGTTSP